MNSYKWYNHNWKSLTKLCRGVMAYTVFTSIPLAPLQCLKNSSFTRATCTGRFKYHSWELGHLLENNSGTRKYALCFVSHTSSQFCCISTCPLKVWDEITYPSPAAKLNHWSLGMNEWFHLLLYNWYDYLSMFRSKLIHVSKMGPRPKKWTHIIGNQRNVEVNIAYFLVITVPVCDLERHVLGHLQAQKLLNLHPMYILYNSLFVLKC